MKLVRFAINNVKQVINERLSVKETNEPKESSFIENIAKYAITNFYRLEATAWEKLYKEQRGGKAYTEMQKEVARLRSKNRKLKKQLNSLDIQS